MVIINHETNETNEKTNENQTIRLLLNWNIDNAHEHCIPLAHSSQSIAAIASSGGNCGSSKVRCFGAPLEVYRPRWKRKRDYFRCGRPRFSWLYHLLEQETKYSGQGIYWTAGKSMLICWNDRYSLPLVKFTSNKQIILAQLSTRFQALIRDSFQLSFVITYVFQIRCANRLT